MTYYTSCTLLLGGSATAVGLRSLLNCVQTEKSQFGFPSIRVPTSQQTCPQSLAISKTIAGSLTCFGVVGGSAQE